MGLDVFEDGLQRSIRRGPASPVADPRTDLQILKERMVEYRIEAFAGLRDRTVQSPSRFGGRTFFFFQINEIGGHGSDSVAFKYIGGLRR